MKNWEVDLAGRACTSPCALPWVGVLDSPASSHGAACALIITGALKPLSLQPLTNSPVVSGFDASLKAL